MKLRNSLYLNFSSIPELAKKARKQKEFNKNIELNNLIKFAASKNFKGIEFPYFRFFKHSSSVTNLINILKQNNQEYILDCEKQISQKELIKLINISKMLKVKFIRIKCSNILSCERHKFQKNWKYKINSIVKKINTIKPLLKKNNIKLAIENHQDLDSNDLINIIKQVGKNYVGINFDIGNAFATCEIPSSFLKKTKNYILNIHLKDYIILPSAKGFSLNRCSIMDGDSKIFKILKLKEKYKIKSNISLELGARSPREINVKSKKFFDFFLKEKKIKFKNAQFIMNMAKENLKKINKLKKLISLNEINMLNKSLKNLNPYK